MALTCQASFWVISPKKNSYTVAQLRNHHHHWLCSKRIGSLLRVRSAYDEKRRIWKSDRPPISIPQHDDVSDIESFIRSKKKFDSQVALVDGCSGKQLTFGNIWDKVRTLGNGLMNMGVGQSDVVMILAYNSIHYPIVFLAVTSIAAIVATPNPTGTPSDMKIQATLANVKFIITTTHLLNKVEQLQIPTIIMDEQQGDFFDKEGNKMNSNRMSNSSSRRRRRRVSDLDDSAAVLYSSGTTGMSKGVVLSHRNIIAQILQLAATQPKEEEEEDEVHLCALPMSHIFGSVVVTCQQLYRGTTSVVLTGFELTAMLTALEQFQITHIYVVPPVVVTLAKSHKLISKFTLNSLRRIICGAAPLGKELVEVCSSKLFPQASFVQVYGLTEVSGVMTWNEMAQSNKYGSVGQLLASMEAKVVDVESNESLGSGCKGELQVRGLTTMKQYINDPVATSLITKPDGWISTGDLVYFDDEGHLYVVDRIKELIKYKALQVAPAELEALLLSHTHILDAAVVPFADEGAGQIPVAFVVVSGDATLSEDDVKSFVAANVASYKRVRKVIFTKFIPKTASGKILRKDLIKQLNNQNKFK